ncbi:hypothetical protein CsSME_00045348 [Camellia sinensis var. sinensis]
MSSTSRRSGSLIGGYWRAWEVYAYFPALGPELVEEVPGTVLFSRVYDGQLRRRTWENFMFFHQYFDVVAAHEVTQNKITWQPWAMIPSGLRAQHDTARVITCHLILLEGPICCA